MVQSTEYFDDGHRDACCTRPRFHDGHKFVNDHDCGCNGNGEDSPKDKVRFAHNNMMLVRPTRYFDGCHKLSRRTRPGSDDKHECFDYPAGCVEDDLTDSSQAQASLDTITRLWRI